MAVDVRRERAVQLRLAGLSRSQIADALGLGSGGQSLSRWLRGVPPPAWTKRPRAKDEARQAAVAMRQQGRSYREIGEVVGVSKSTLSLWLRDIPLTDEQRVALALRAPQATSARAEGAKNKPWRTGTRVEFLNSDPAMIQLFLGWLSLLRIERDRLQFRVYIHESADVTGAECFWAQTVGVSIESLERTTLKRHNPKTVRRNVGEDYHGCLCVSVRRSADLNLRIAGWFKGIAAGASTLVVPSGVV